MLQARGLSQDQHGNRWLSTHFYHVWSLYKMPTQRSTCKDHWADFRNPPGDECGFDSHRQPSMIRWGHKIPHECIAHQAETCLEGHPETCRVSFLPWGLIWIESGKSNPKCVFPHFVVNVTATTSPQNTQKAELRFHNNNCKAKEALHIHMKGPSLNRNIGKVRIPSVFSKLLKPYTQLLTFT